MKFLSSTQVYVIAEIGINHNGDLQVAKNLIDEAVKAGVDAVKFQVRCLEEIYTKKVLADPLKAEQGTQYLLDQIKKAFLTFDQIKELHEYTKKKHTVDFFATPFDSKSADFLNSLGVELFKLGSPDFTNLPLIKKVIAYGKPLILSTGMANEEEIKTVIDFLDSKKANFYLLHCNSTYPASIQDINLKYLSRLKELTKDRFGYSGHEQGFAPSLAAVALGAHIIERHITYDRNSSGPDHRASLLPSEFADMISAIREIESALGICEKVVNQGESNNKLALAKSLVYSKDFPVGHVITEDDLIAKTPAKGLSPLLLPEFIGRPLTVGVSEEDFVSKDDFEKRAEDHEFKIPNTWGIVGRLNDFDEFLSLRPDLVEIHLTWRDLVDFDLSKFKNKGNKYTQDLVVHAPEYFKDQLIDFTTGDAAVRDLSIEMLNRAFDLARGIADQFEGVDKNIGPRVVVHPGGHFKVHTDSNRTDQYRALQKNLKVADSRGLRVLVENMPPFPWYFGGQWHNTIFLDPGEIAQFAKEMNWGVCYDLSHALLYCNHANIKIADFTKKIFDHISYLHISDAAGTTQEGLQLGEGNLDYEHLTEILGKLDVGFIPEIWQGHLNKGKGFTQALNFIEKLVKKHSSASCTLGKNCVICSTVI